MSTLGRLSQHREAGIRATSLTRDVILPASWGNLVKFTGQVFNVQKTDYIFGISMVKRVTSE